jgi:hypothetical protein
VSEVPLDLDPYANDRALLSDDRLTATVCDGSRSNYRSYVLAGLYELRAMGKLAIRYEQPVSPLPPPAFAHLRLRLERRRGPPLALHFDLTDAPEIWQPDLVERADVYVKRSWHADHVRALGPRLARKVIPMGLQYPCASRTESMADSLARAANTVAPGDLVQRGKRVAGALSHPLARRIESIQEPRYIDELECAPDLPAARSIYFRTRLFEPDSAANDRAREHRMTLNRGRVAVIRALRDAFGSQFHGGLDDSPASLRHHPELVWALPERHRGQRGHLLASRAHLVNVTTIGVSGSTPWKFPEALAAGRCLVSEAPPYTSLDGPRPGEHFVSFTNPDECVAACARLLEDPGEAEALRRRAFTFYQTSVHPGAALPRVFERAFLAQASGVA